ncbi:MAG: TldD/PmbA family protein [bacterium]
MRDRLLELAAQRAEQAEVFSIETDQSEVEFRQGKLYAQGTKLAKGWGVRVIKEGRVGFASSSDPQRMEDVVEAAGASAAYGKAARFDFPGPMEPAAVNTFENKVMLVSAARMAEWGRDLIDALASRTAELKLDVSLSRVYKEIGVSNSQGLDVSFERTELQVMVSGILVDDGIYWFNDYVNLSDAKPFPLDTVVTRMERFVRMAKRRARLKTGDYPVIVTPLALGELLLPLKVAVDGKQREKGTSPLMGKEGQQVLSEKITLIDNRLHPFGLASAPIDDEGMPARKNVLFDRGVFKGFLFDLATAAACNTVSTASAVRNYQIPPYPGIGNLELAPGNAELDDVMREIDEGLLVYGFIGGGMSNILAGEVTLNVSCGFKIEKGAIAGRVKDLSIAGNVYEMFQKVQAVGRTQRDLGDAFLPFVSFSALKVAAKD